MALSFSLFADKAAVRRVLWAGAPALAALVVYAATLSAAFIYDDDVLIRTNRSVQDAGALYQIPWTPLLASSPTGSTNYYRPLVVGLYNLTWHIGGGRPFAFHVLNVLMHMLNATLLLQLVRRFTGPQDLTAVGIATLFAVHPLNVEVVAWPSCLPELGYTACGLSALLLHVGAWNRGDTSARRLRAAAYVLFALACLCKETAFAFVPLIVLLELWLRPGRAVQTRVRVLSGIRSVVPYLGAGALFLAARTAVLGGLIPRGRHGSRTILDAALNAPWLLLLYVKSMFVPSPLLVEHLVPLVKSATDSRFILGAVTACAGVAAVVWLRRRRPDLAFAACVAVLPLLPALYLPALGRDPFAERYAYLGVAGFCWLCVGGADALVRTGVVAVPRWAMPSLVVAIVLAAGARTAARARDWHDDETLGRASMRDEPRAAIGYMLAGSWHLREGSKDEALSIFQDGLSHVPESVELQQNTIGLGIELGRLSHDDALAAYERLVPLASGSASAEFNIGQMLLQNGRLDKARAAFARSLELSPDSVASMTALAVIASQQGDDATAVGFCRRALALDNRSRAALQQLGVSLMRTGDVHGAISALQRDVELEPGDKDGLARLGVAYEHAGALDDARRAWERALAIDPDFADARRSLERLRRTAR
jgi:tetratricopeptide (TPR) repeat protein